MPGLRIIAILTLILASSVSAFAQKMTVKIIGRQDNETAYTYVLPGHSTSTSTENANCYGNANNVNCSGTATTNGSSTPAQQVSFHVTGATLALQLADGRVAVVNCQSKFAERFAGPQGNRRGCHVPLGDSIQAEFHGDNAKLEWVVSLDGKKTQSETYKILGILDKPTN